MFDRDHNDAKRQRRSAARATRARAAQARAAAARLPGWMLTQARKTGRRLRPGAKKEQATRRARQLWLAAGAGIAALGGGAVVVLRRLRGQPATESQPADTATGETTETESAETGTDTSAASASRQEPGDSDGRAAGSVYSQPR